MILKPQVFLSATKLIAIYSILTGTTALFAQQYVPSTPQNVVQLSASGSVEVQQDLLSISMATTRDGPDAGTVQNQLKVALDAALTESLRVFRSCPLITPKHPCSLLQMLAIARAMAALCA